MHRLFVVESDARIVSKDNYDFGLNYAYVFQREATGSQIFGEVERLIKLLLVVLDSSATAERSLCALHR